ncbi:MAG TPA: hypothetical protein VGU72_06855 [Beijerinckiaceae bacterium]|jgi:hypothetical protein|nr:hypothetical protein [Beijerinckiaceae bacterium]
MNALVTAAVLCLAGTSTALATHPIPRVTAQGQDAQSRYIVIRDTPRPSRPKPAHAHYGPVAFFGSSAYAQPGDPDYVR